MAFHYLLLGVVATLCNADIVTVPLLKEHVAVTSEGRTLLHKTAYYGTVKVGIPAQNFTVVFDTGSGHLFVPSSRCTSEACTVHQTYDRYLSKTALDINSKGLPIDTTQGSKRDMVSIQYGTGEIVGSFVREIVCLGVDNASSEIDEENLPAHCTKMRLIMAKRMSTNPFKQFNFDGVIGLGLKALAVHPEFHFFSQLTKQHPSVSPVFSFYLSRTEEDGNEITIGGYLDSRMKGPMSWSPVVEAEEGHWRVGIVSVLVGDKELEVCQSGNCSAIVDTGTSLLGVPRSSMRPIFAGTLRTVPEASTVDGLDCRQIPGPNITFNMVGGFQLVLGADAYSRPAAGEIKKPDGNQVVCQSIFLPVDLMETPVFLFGEPVLQKYYTSFDTDGQRIGFAPARHASQERLEQQPSEKAEDVQQVTV